MKFRRLLRPLKPLAVRVRRRLPQPVKARLLSNQIVSRETLHDFWRQNAPEGNAPEGFIRPLGRSAALLDLLRDLPHDATVLEVGCNVGRNLAYLHDHGYQKLTGVEISPYAVELLRTTYPQLSDTDIHVGPAETVLPRFADGAFDLVFTMAVLEHIHPDSGIVFDEIARIGRNVLAIEPDAHASSRQYPHNIPRLFTDRGKHVLRHQRMNKFPSTRDDPSINTYHAWWFA